MHVVRSGFQQGHVERALEAADAASAAETSAAVSSPASGTGGRAPAPFRGPAADSALGEAFLDVPRFL
jgi:hypothetical protein